MEWERRLVSVAATALRRYHEGASLWAAFNALLDGVIRVTASHYGYIGRIVPREGKLTILVKAITTIGWSPKMVDLVVPEGFTFALEDMSTGPRLYGMSWRTRAPFICNDPSTSPHSRGGVPSGHPDIDHFMEMPIFWGDRIIGLLALANRPGGFAPHHAAWLQGFLSMLATLMQLYECVPSQPSSTSSSSSSSSSSTPATKTEAPTTPASSSTSKSTTPRGEAETTLPDEPSQTGRAAQSYHFHPQPLGVADFDAREISHAVLDSVGEGVVVLDAKLRLRHVNNGAVRMLGYTSGRALLSRCRHLSDVIPYYDEERAMDWSRFSDGVQQKMLGAHVATHARSMGGGLLSIDLSLSSFIFQRKRYFSAVFSDISQKKKSVERNKFLAFLSHEIRNPLQAIISGLQVLQSEWKEEEVDLSGASATNMMAIMHRATSIMHRVIDDIVDYTRIETHQFSMKKEEFDIRSTLQIAIEMAKKTEWHKGNLDMALEVERSVPRRAFCDRKRVEQVLMNLLTNAQKYTEHGRIVVRCRVDTQGAMSGEMKAIPVIPDSSSTTDNDDHDYSEGGLRLDGESGEDDDSSSGDDREKHPDGSSADELEAIGVRYLCIEVEDTGIGISEEDQKNLFSVYTHIDDPTLMCSEKTGLGLAITKRLCTVMGGNLWCRSQLGKGSSFTFHVPFDTVPEDDSPHSPSSEWQTAPETHQSQLRQQLEPTLSSPPAASALFPTTHNDQSNRNHLSGLRVLVVDDNSLMRKTMNAILSKEQCHVTLAENGQQAIDIVMKNKEGFDVMLIDCLMPVKDGYRMVAELREEGIDTPMIAITGNSLTEQTQQCRQVGFDYCLLKPVQKAELFDTILHYTTSRNSAKACK